MSVSVTLPQMGESVTEGTIIRWLKEEGDQVTEDEPLVEISTDKIDTELPAPSSGVLAKIIVGQDQTVDVGTELAVIEADGDGAAAKGAPREKPAKEKPAKEKPAKEKPAKEEAKDEPDPAKEKPAEEKAAPKAAAEPSKAAPKAAAAEPAKAAPAAAPEPDSGARASSPLVRKLARDLDVDLTTVQGSGSAGRITRDDVLGAARAGRPRTAARGVTPDPSRYEVPSEEHADIAFDRVRKAIAQHMRHSRATAAHVTDVIEVDMTHIADLRERTKDAFKRREGTSLTFMPFIAAAAVQALRTYPEFNAHLLEDGATARLFQHINLGIAVGRDEGLIVPVVHGADGLNLTGLARAIAGVGERARTKGGLTPDDVTGGTFTLTNYGSLGALMDTPIIHQPQVAILGIGAVLKRPAVISADGVDAIAIRHLMMLSLSYDHRWIDGHQAARFNSRLKQLLETTDHSGELGL